MAPLQPPLLDGDELTSDLTVRLEYHGEENRFRAFVTVYEHGRRTTASRWLTIDPGGDYGNLPRAVARAVEGWLYDPHFAPSEALLRILTDTRWGRCP